MPRYIDADALLKAMDTWDKFGFSHSGAFVREPENDDYVPYVHYGDMVKCVEGMPTADVVERKKGRWNTDKESPEYATCSVCGHCDWDCTESEYFKYCPNCGAQMEANDGEVR